MRYVIRTVLGMGLFAFCWVLVGYSLYQLLQVGTCASGGPYVPARVCPDGIERLMFALMGGILGLFVAAGIYAGRGAPPGSDREPSNGGIIVWFWTGLFWSIAAGGLLGVWGPEANAGPGGNTGGLIVGFMGVIMGAGGLLAINWRGRRRDSERLFGGATKLVQPAARFTPAGNPIDALESLDRLRRSGTLSEAEFETLKQKILAGS